MTDLRIFIVEDHGVVREGLKLLLSAQPDMTVVGEAGDAERALEQLASCQPHVVLIDISLPGMSGVAATTCIIEQFPQVKVLALSVHEEPIYLRQLLQAGASGYVLKRSASESLIVAIRMVMNGGVYIDPTLASKVLNRLAGPDAAPQEPVTELSSREADVLRLTAHGYTNREIGEKLNVSMKTVETYKARAMQKLGIESRTAIVRYALQQGWLEQTLEP